MSHLDLSYWVVLLVRLSNCWNKMDYIAKICQNDIIHFQRIFHCKPSSYWGTSLYGNLHNKPLIKPFSGPQHREELLEHWKEVLERLSIPHSKACRRGRLWRCLEEPNNGLGMTSNCCFPWWMLMLLTKPCAIGEWPWHGPSTGIRRRRDDGCRECNDYIWLYCIILRTDPDVCPGAYIFFV